MSETKFPPCPFRVGLGSDIHRLIQGDGVVLGGVFVPCSFSCEAVSDGDVLLHALVDALLGACGWGDIGEWYPAEAVAPGQASEVFVREVTAKLRAAGYAVGNVDCIVELEVVRLSGWKEKIRASLAALLRIDPERVNVKAKTAEGMGPVGEGKAVAARVAVLVLQL